MYHCFSFRFTQKTKQIISEVYNDCLCNDCLNQFKQYERLEKEEVYLNDKQIYIEGLHYHIKKNLWVFTEYYHYLRGHCCQNNCKY